MKKRIADIVADALAAHGITQVFSLVGGGAMFLNDAFGHHPKLNVVYTQHEQACSMAAEGYVRTGGRMAGRRVRDHRPRRQQRHHRRTGRIPGQLSDAGGFRPGAL